MTRSDRPAVAWLDRFFDVHHRRRPVDATFIGVHAHDHRLPDFTEEGAGDTLADIQDLLASAPAVDLGRWTDGDVDALDVRLAAGFLRIASWEMGSAHFHRGNPSLYTGEAVFGVLSLFLTEHGPLRERVEAARARMEEVPAFLGQARANVRSAPAAWLERAVRECDGALALFTDGLRALAAERSIEDVPFARAAERAARAFARHRAHLEAQRTGAGRGGVACGEEALALHLREGHFLEADADEIARYAEEALAAAASEQERGASGIGVGSPEEAVATLSGLHPDTDGYYGRYGEIWEEMRALAEEKGLVTWPDFPIRYVPRPGWTRTAAPHLYFLHYRSPAAFARPPVHECLVTPVEPSMPARERERLLGANNDSVIKLNHVVHHGGLGHHVQNWHAFRAASRVGRIAAVDCAARIAMLCGGTMAEGWACYATDLVAEAGGLTALEAYAERRSRVRMCARAVVDVRLHQGRFTLDDAAACYERVAGMPAAAARDEAVKNSMFPGGALMYLVGTDAIHRLRRDLSALGGAAFDLRAFHDAFLAHGSVPVSLIAEKMKKEAARRGPSATRRARAPGPGARPSNAL